MKLTHDILLEAKAAAPALLVTGTETKNDALLRMADALIRNAILASGGTPRDDMTAQVLLLMTRQQG